VKEEHRIAISISQPVFLDGATPESNRASVGLPHRTGFEDQLGHRTLPLQDRDRTDVEWGARQLADAVISAVRDIRRQRPNPDDRPTS